MNIKNWFKSQEGPMDMEAEFSLLLIHLLLLRAYEERCRTRQAEARLS